VVVRGFCASAGAALRIANAKISVFITSVPLLFVDVKSGRGGIALPPLLRCHPSSAVMAVELDKCVARPQARPV